MVNMPITLATIYLLILLFVLLMFFPTQFLGTVMAWGLLLGILVAIIEFFFWMFRGPQGLGGKPKE